MPSNIVLPCLPTWCKPIFKHGVSMSSNKLGKYVFKQESQVELVSILCLFVCLFVILLNLEVLMHLKTLGKIVFDPPPFP